MIRLGARLNHGANIGSCCGSMLIHKNKPFKMQLGIIIGEGSRKYTPKNHESFVVIETKNGPLSIATRGKAVAKRDKK